MLARYSEAPMRSDIMLDDISELADARLFYLVASKWLWTARVNHQPSFVLRTLEREVGKALNRLWEAQQNA